MKGEIAARYREFDIPGTAQVVEGNGGLPKVQITRPDVIGEMYFHGAHITSWKPHGAEEALFLSSQSRWEDGRAIRGGIPICFPWFGGKADDPKAPAHGFVRTKSWHLESISDTQDGVIVTMFTQSDETTKRWWPAEFRLVYRATFGRDLGLELMVSNTGKTSLRFEEALHTYHRVGNINDSRVRGLNGVQYVDKTDSNRRKMQQGDITIGSETDRVYLNTGDAVELNDSLLQRTARVMKENSHTTVVWNPWIDKARELADMAGSEWTQLFCIETSNVSDFAVDLVPGQQHAMKATVSISDL